VASARLGSFLPVILVKCTRQGPFDFPRCLQKCCHLGLALIVAIALPLSISTPARTVEAADSHLGQIMGTVTDVNGDPVIKTIIRTGTLPDLPTLG
jgi:hypothetical protein